MMPRPISRRSFLTTSARAAGGLAVASSLGPVAARQPARATALKGTLSIFDFGCLSLPALQKGILRAYEALHPGVTIQLVSAPSGIDNTTYTITQLTAGTAPDIVGTAVAQEQWSDLTRDWWVELTQWVDSPNPYDPQKRTFRDVFQPVYLNQLQLDNRFWSITTAGQDAMIYYNKDLFARAGITGVPATWDALLAAQAQLQKAGIIPFGMDGGDLTYADPFPSLPAIIESQTMAGTIKKIHPGPGIVTLDELVAAVDNGTFSAMHADYQETWRLLKDWSRYWQPGYAVNANTFPTPAAHLFFTGKCAMYWAGSYLIPIIESSVPKNKTFAWGVFPFPQITPASSSFATPGAKNVGVWGAWGTCAWGITSDGHRRGHEDLARDFLFYLSAPRQAAYYNQFNTYIPLYKGIPIRGSNALETKTLTAFNRVMGQPCALSTAETALGPSVQLQRTKLLQSYLTGQLSLGTAMSQMEPALMRAARQARQWLQVAQHKQ
jgi:ABC-type glycerol-3-phosphate transport system substrate-binding protein